MTFIRNCSFKLVVLVCYMCLKGSSPECWTLECRMRGRNAETQNAESTALSSAGMPNPWITPECRTLRAAKASSEKCSFNLPPTYSQLIRGGGWQRPSHWVRPIRNRGGVVTRPKQRPAIDTLMRLLAGGDLSTLTMALLSSDCYTEKEDS